MGRHTRFAAAAAIGLAAMTAIVAPRPLRAQLALTVDTGDDEPDAQAGDGRCRTARGACSLRAAIQEANATPGRDQVSLPQGSFVFDIAGSDEDAAATGDLDIADDLGIAGQGMSVSDVNASGLDTVFHVLPGVNAELSGLSVSGGVVRRAFDAAGGIYNQGTLRLRDVWVVSNVAQAPYGVGGLLNRGDAVIESSRFEQNTPTAIETTTGSVEIRTSVLRSNGPGVAVVADGGAVTLGDSEIANQLGTAMFCQGTSVRVVRSHIHHTRPGGAMLIPSASVTVLDSLIEANEGGGINNDGGLRVERTTLRANNPPDDGAGAQAAETGAAAGIAGVTAYTGITNSSGTVVIDSAVLDHRGGGLVNEEGVMRLVNVTVSGNGGAGGVINFGDEIEVRNGTITNNHSLIEDAAGGLATYPDSANLARVANTIIAGNTSVSAAPDCAGPLESLGHNLVGDSAGCEGLATAEGDLLDADPGLGALADNGGVTLTYALLDGSAAIDAGSPLPVGGESAACAATDQRGAGRPQGAGCDIGAFEVISACGDGALDSGEDCDDGNLDAGDCCSPFCRHEALDGDCDASGAVGIDDLLLSVTIALGTGDVDDCGAADGDDNGQVSIAELVTAVQSAMTGCQSPPM